jgi:hypothetical protein
MKKFQKFANVGSDNVAYLHIVFLFMTAFIFAFAATDSFYMEFNPFDGFNIFSATAYFFFVAAWGYFLMHISEGIKKGLSAENITPTQVQLNESVHLVPSQSVWDRVCNLTQNAWVVCAVTIFFLTLTFLPREIERTLGIGFVLQSYFLFSAAFSIVLFAQCLSWCISKQSRQTPGKMALMAMLTFASFLGMMLSVPGLLGSYGLEEGVAFYNAFNQEPTAILETIILLLFLGNFLLDAKIRRMRSKVT